MLMMASCGQTYKLMSIAATPSTGCSLEALGDTCQVHVTATFSNSKTSDVTLSTTHQLNASAAPNDAAPLSVNGVPAVTVSNALLVTASSTVGVCTWTAVPNTDGSGKTTYTYGTNPYELQLSYTNDGTTATTSVPINVNSVVGCYDAKYPHP
jgi:hypothetical protein